MTQKTHTGLIVSFPGPTRLAVHFHCLHTPCYRKYHFIRVRVSTEKFKKSVKCVWQICLHQQGRWNTYLKNSVCACCTYCVHLAADAHVAPTNSVFVCLWGRGDVSNLARRKSSLLCSECEVLKHHGVTWKTWHTVWSVSVCNYWHIKTQSYLRPFKRCWLVEIFSSAHCFHPLSFSLKAPLAKCSLKFSAL